MPDCRLFRLVKYNNRWITAWVCENWVANIVIISYISEFVAVIVALIFFKWAGWAG